MKKKRNRKKFIWIPLLLVLAGGLAFGGYKVFQNRKGNAVAVYAVSDIRTDGWFGSTEMNGMITNSASQTVYEDSVMNVEKLYVENGQQVKKGDKLLSYDMTLKELDLKDAKLNLELAEEKVKRIRREIKNPKKYIMESDDFSVADTADDGASASTGGGGSTNLSTASTGDHAPSMSADADGQSAAGTAQADSGTTSADQTDATADNGQVNADTKAANQTGAAAGTQGTAGSSASTDKKQENISVQDSGKGEKLDPDDPYNTGAADTVDPEKVQPTKEELKNFVEDKKMELKEAELSVDKAKLKVSGLEKSTDKKDVTAKYDGTVTFGEEGSGVLLKVENTGGLFIKGMMNEYAVVKNKVGDVLNVNDYFTDQQFTATIKEISDVPSSSSAYYYDSYSGSKASYYDFVAEIEGTPQVNTGDDCILTTEGSATVNDALYLEKAFLRLENGKCYVYMADGNNRLVKKRVKINNAGFGEIVEVVEGVRDTDRIAFPYGKNIREGAVTVDKDVENLYQ